MFTKNKICKKLNPFASCKKYSVPLRQCPQFLFVIMGLIIMGVIFFTYFLTTSKLNDPLLAALIVLIGTMFLIIINFVITNSFERMAEASRMKTELINIVSHQLRAPLTNIRFSLDFLISDSQTQTPSEQAEYFSIIKENSNRMNDLVNNLLTVSRIETGRFPLENREVSLKDIIYKIVEKFKAYIVASNVKVDLDIQENVSNVIADPLWLSQIVENLLDNAIKYTKGGGKINIKLFQKNGKVIFHIKDQGIGIPKEEQPYVFGKFFRSKNVSKAKTHGSGLGLHIVKKVVELLHGKVWFKSEENKGTTFAFYLPAKENKA